LIRRASPPLRRDGRPVSTATWYLRDDGRVLLNMDADRKRLEQMRHDPRVALDLLDESDWYTHVSMTAHLEKLRRTPAWPTSTAWPQQYTGRPYPRRDRRWISAGSPWTAGTAGVH
jgi:hypothetical protein